jgi:hypothetical protein
MSHVHPHENGVSPGHSGEAGDTAKEMSISGMPMVEASRHELLCGRNDRVGCDAKFFEERRIRR